MRTPNILPLTPKSRKLAHHAELAVGLFQERKSVFLEILTPSGRDVVSITDRIIYRCRAGFVDEPVLGEKGGILIANEALLHEPGHQLHLRLPDLQEDFLEPRHSVIRAIHGAERRQLARLGFGPIHRASWRLPNLDLADCILYGGSKRLGLSALRSLLRLKDGLETARLPLIGTTLRHGRLWLLTEQPVSNSLEHGSAEGTAATLDERLTCVAQRVHYVIVLVFHVCHHQP